MPAVSDIPEGFAEGSEVETQVEGSLEIRGISVPLVFDIEVRDDGDRGGDSGQDDVYVAAAGHYATEGGAVTRIEDEVRVEVLLSVEPGG